MPPLNHMAIGVVERRAPHLADVAGGRLEGGGGEPDQVQAGHDAGQVPEGAAEGGHEVEVDGPVPVHVPGEDRDDPRAQGEGEGDQGDGLGHPDGPPQAAQVDGGEDQHDQAWP